MAEYDVDLFTIGAGSGGVRLSRMAAQRGARVACAEERHLGGTCVNVGCIPKKLLVYASQFRGHALDAAGYGFSFGEPTFSWQRLIEQKDAEIRRLNEVYRGLLERAGVSLIEGRARVVDPHAVEVGGRRVTAETILVAVGGRPIRPAIPGIERCIVSDDVFRLERLPERLLVGGGGYIGVELAGVFAGLGTKVTLVHRGSLFLRGFDEMLRRALAEEMTKQGVDLRFEHTVERVEPAGRGVRATLSDGAVLEVDHLLCAMGREPYTRDLGLREAGVALNEQGAVVVDELSRTSVPSIYAVGDVTDRLNLTPMAIAEGAAFAETVYRSNPTRPDHHDVPTAVFSHPPIGTVGLTEEEARSRLESIRVYSTSFIPLKHRLTGRDERTRMKLVVDAATDRVVGCHLIGEDAPEIVQGFAVAVKCGAKKRDLDATIGIHPTAAEELVTMRKPDLS